jgi:hypothetical protein
LLEKTKHPFIHCPLHSIDDKCSYTADAQAAEEDAYTLCLVGMSCNLERGQLGSLRLWAEQ